MRVGTAHEAIETAGGRSSGIETALRQNVVMTSHDGERGHGGAAAPPVSPEVRQRFAQLIREGRLNWTGRRLVPPLTRPTLRGGTTLAAIVVRDRGRS